MDRCTLALTLLAVALPASARAEDAPEVVQFTDHDGASADWKTHATRAGVTIERRAVKGSSYYEHRGIVDVPVDPALAATEVWRALRDGDMESLKHRDTLRSEPDELVLYDQIKTPVVSDRDYTITVRRQFDPVLRRTRFRCETANELGPPPARGYVRIPVIRAGWVTEPDGHGGTRLTYYSFSEPGGSVPAFLVRGVQADRSLGDVLHMVRRLKAASAAAPATPR